METIPMTDVIEVDNSLMEEFLFCSSISATVERNCGKGTAERERVKGSWNRKSNLVVLDKMRKVEKHWKEKRETGADEAMEARYC